MSLLPNSFWNGKKTAIKQENLIMTFLLCNAGIQLATCMIVFLLVTVTHLLLWYKPCLFILLFLVNKAWGDYSQRLLKWLNSGPNSAENDWAIESTWIISSTNILQVRATNLGYVSHSLLNASMILLSIYMLVFIKIRI